MKIHCKYDELVNPKSLKQHPKNRNDHPQDQIKRLAQILDYQGWRYPIKVSKASGFVTSGHGRIAAAIINGWKEIPVNYQEYESEEQEYADLIADNSIASWSELNLSAINTDIVDIGPDFDIDLLGIKDFVVEPLDKLEPGCDEDESLEPPKDPISKPGDLYILGSHRLKCGDSTNVQHIEELMNGEKADMVFTDPPYNTGMSAKKNSGSTWLSHMFDDDFSNEEWNQLLSSLSSQCWLICKDQSVAYICLNWKRSKELVSAVTNAGFKFSNLIVWDKVVHGLGSDYKYTHEFIHVFKKGSPKLNTHQGDQEYKDIWHVQRKVGRDDDHATKKPIELVDRAIRHASRVGQICADLFGGSGSTLTSCQKNNRRCFMMELNPTYIDVIVSRYCKFTNTNKVIRNGEEIEWELDGKTKKESRSRTNKKPSVN